MYGPQFTYNLSRPYPYKWFPWVVFIGGIAALTLFSVVNFAANGYDLGAQYTTDPNGTEAQTSWTEAPIFSLLNRVGPSCQAQNIPVNTEFYTSKLSLPYTLTNIWRESADGPSAVLPSLAYKNNTLENCSVIVVQIDLDSAQRTAMQQGYTPWGAKATASPPLILPRDSTDGFKGSSDLFCFQRSRIDVLQSDHRLRICWHNDWDWPNR